MLEVLNIQNFAVIKNTSISFKPGLNVITGETGTGKSIIFKALDFLSGTRASNDLIRHGEESLVVQAVFSINPDQKAQLSLYEDFAVFIENNSVEELIISRKFNLKGKNRIDVNGCIVTLASLKKLMSCLLSICSQGQQHTLLSAATHLTLLTKYYSEDTSEYLAAYQSWQEVKKKYEYLQEIYEDLDERIEELQDEIDDLEKLDLRKGLRDELRSSLAEIRRAGDSLVTFQNIQEILDEENGLFANIQRLQKQLNFINDLQSQDLLESFKQLQYAAEAFEADLRQLTPEQSDLLEQGRIEEDLALLSKMLRRYQTDESGLIQQNEDLKEELSDLSKLESLDFIKKQFAEFSESLKSVADCLSKERKKQSRCLSKDLIKILNDLNLPNVEFAAKFQTKEYAADGQDRVEFLISTNPGQAVKPLAKVSSGGELSRILLAFRLLFQNKNADLDRHVLLFDEIDSGISGSTARIVGKKLKAISTGNQIICISHLPQIAGLADQHLYVEKFQNEETFSNIRALIEEEKIDEVARLISGEEVSDEARRAARDLII